MSAKHALRTFLFQMDSVLLVQLTQFLAELIINASVKQDSLQMNMAFVLENVELIKDMIKLDNHADV